MDPMTLNALYIAAAALICVAAGMSFQVADKLLTITAALPNGATNTSTTAIDLEHNNARQDFLANCEFLVSIPALTTTQLGDTQTITVSVETDNDAAFGSAKVVISSLFVMTGAGGAGAAAASDRFRLPSNCERYVRVKATKTGASNASTASMTFQQLF